MNINDLKDLINDNNDKIEPLVKVKIVKEIFGMIITLIVIIALTILFIKI